MVGMMKSISYSDVITVLEEHISGGEIDAATGYSCDSTIQKFKSDHH